MKKYLESLPQELKGLIQLAAKTAILNNVSVYPVGGFVRDLILGVENLDLDFVVEGNGIAFAQDFARALSAKLIRHERFGTATIMPGHHIKIDIATARKEIYPKPAALPVVEFGTIKDDLKRRDFTINAMAIDIAPDNFGRLIDYFGGRLDLSNKKIRILHALSFIDDPTRILRAIRFEQRYDFKIESETLKILKDASCNAMLELVGPQRIRDELILMLKEASVFKQVKRAQGLVGFCFMNCALKPGPDTYRLLKSAEKQINWYNKVHFHRRKLDSWLVYLMALADSLPKKETVAFCRKLVFRKGEEKRILSAKKISASFIRRLSQKGLKPSLIFQILEPLSYETILFIKAKYRPLAIKKHIEDFLEIYSDMRLCISGHHLHKMGLIPGPRYQQIFAKALKAKLNGLVKTEEEELAFIRKLIKNGEKADVKSR